MSVAAGLLASVWLAAGAGSAPPPERLDPRIDVGLGIHVLGESFTPRFAVGSVLVVRPLGFLGIQVEGFGSPPPDVTRVTTNTEQLATAAGVWALSTWTLASATAGVQLTPWTVDLYAPDGSRESELGWFFEASPGIVATWDQGGTAQYCTGGCRDARQVHPTVALGTGVRVVAPKGFLVAVRGVFLVHPEDIAMPGAPSRRFTRVAPRFSVVFGGSIAVREQARVEADADIP